MALPDKIRHSATNYGPTVNTSIDSGNYATSTAYDNATNRYTHLSAMFRFQYSSAPTAGKTVEIHLLYSLDGGYNYEEISPHSLRAVVSPPADTDMHYRVVLDGIPIGPHLFKLAVKNVDTEKSVSVVLSSYVWHTEVAD